MLPVTFNDINVPTDVRLEPVTPEFMNVPVSVSALAELAVTPVS
jgi:hypothetical protein